MIRSALLALAALLAACDSPSPRYAAGGAESVEVDGSRFSVRLDGAEAEVTRTSVEMLPKFEEVARKARIALVQVSGCEVAWLEGDIALIRAGLSCNGAPAPAQKTRRRLF